MGGRRPGSGREERVSSGARAGVLSLAASAALGFGLIGCASGGGIPEPVVSPTGTVYEAGTPPRETRFSQTASLYLRTDRPEQAAEQALQGVRAYPENPIHYFLAGVALARTGEWDDADRMLREAQRRYPAYELEIEPEREAAWAEGFNRGSRAYAEGDVEGAIEAWLGAAVLFDLRPEVHRNLARVLAAEGRYEEAIRVFQEALGGLEKRPATRVLDAEELEQRRDEARRIEEDLAVLLLQTDRFAEAEPLLRQQLERDPESVQARQRLALALGGLGRSQEAGELYDHLLDEGALPAPDLFNVGVLLFRAGDYRRAGRAFQGLVRLRPWSRDAWFNYANALFAAERWDELLTVAERLVELDPLSETASLIAARARLETGDEAGALQGLERTGELPVHVEGLAIRHEAGQTKVQGRIVGNRAGTGEAIRLRFTFYDDQGELGTTPVTLSAPSPEESAAFEVSFHARATAYRYQVEGAGAGGEAGEDGAALPPDVSWHRGPAFPILSPGEVPPPPPFRPASEPSGYGSPHPVVPDRLKEVVP